MKRQIPLEERGPPQHDFSKAEKNFLKGVYKYS